MTDKPKLSLPGTKPAPAPTPMRPPTLQDLVFAEIERVGHNKKALFEAVMARIDGDQDMFRRFGGSLIHHALRKRIKNTMRGLSYLKKAGRQPGETE